MVKKGLVGLAVVFVMLLGGIFLDGSGIFLPSAGKPVSLGNALHLAQTNSAWTVNEETTTSGPWTGQMQMLYKPVKPLVVDHHPRARFDVVVSERLEYHGIFPPTLISWPDMVEWPKGEGGASQGPPIKPMKLNLGTFLYANYSVNSPNMLISAAELHKAFTTANFDIVWRSLTALPPTQFWAIGPVHTRVLAFKTSLP